MVIILTKMSIEELQELGSQLINLSKQSSICATLIEECLQNLRDYFCQPNENEPLKKDFENVMPPQIIIDNSTNGSISTNIPQNIQPPRYPQRIISKINNQMNPLLVQAQQIPFLFHDQQI